MTATYRAHEACAATGASERQLQWWRRTELVVPSGSTPGGQRRYTPRDLRRIRLLLLVTSGPRERGRAQPISVRKAGRILERLHAEVEGWLEISRAEALADALSERRDLR